MIKKLKKENRIILGALVAADRNGAIGKNNSLPWKVKSDLQFFKEKTMGHHIIMGRRTYESIGKPLPGRMTIVLTRDASYRVPGSIVASSVIDAIKACPKDEESFVVGGAHIYKEFWNILDLIYFTQIHTEVSGADAYFPQLTPKEWVLLRETVGHKTKEDDFNFTFQTFLRKSLIAKNIDFK